MVYNWSKVLANCWFKYLRDQQREEREREWVKSKWDISLKKRKKEQERESTAVSPCWPLTHHCASLSLPELWPPDPRLAPRLQSTTVHSMCLCVCPCVWFWVSEETLFERDNQLTLDQIVDWLTNLPYTSQRTDNLKPVIYWPSGIPGKILPHRWASGPSKNP